MTQDLKTIYRVSELAALAGVSRRAMLSLLAGHGITPLRQGRGKPKYVTISELRSAMPELWESMLLARALR